MINKLRIIIFLLSADQTVSTSSGYGEWSADSTSRISHLMKAGGIPGLSAVVVDSRQLTGTPVETAVTRSFHFGYSRLGCPEPDAEKYLESCAVSERSIFGIGRLSQLFVSTVVLKSAQKGFVTLDAPISTYLASRGTDLNSRKLPSVWSFDGFRGKLLGRVTLRQLLAHTACLKDGPNVAMRHTQAGDTSYSLKQYLRYELTNDENWVQDVPQGFRRIMNTRRWELLLLRMYLNMQTLQLEVVLKIRTIITF